MWWFANRLPTTVYRTDSACGGGMATVRRRSEAETEAIEVEQTLRLP